MAETITFSAPAGKGKGLSAPMMLGDMAKQDPSKIPLPSLRDDLHIMPGLRDRGGALTYTLYDPVRHRYHSLSLLAFEMLQRWPAGTIGALCDRVAQETHFAPTIQDCAQLIHFLRSNGLVDLSTAQDLKGWLAQTRASRPPLLTWLIHNYLFIRIPLVRPDPFLARLWPIVRFVYSKGMLVVLGLLLCLGLYLVSRQWDSFVRGFATYASWEGIFWTAVTLVCAKVIHELGHAFTAYRYGCRVASMGVAFLVLMPVLYTDTSDSWRLPSYHKRLAIGIAGIVAEVCLAILATVLWSFLPDGAARNAVFIIASASWVTTLAINLSPFMRFDGYYLLSDLWQIPNLQARAFAYARWWMREKLFAFGDRKPEPWSKRTQFWLLVYSFGTWVYRLLLFVGIALLVYHMTFKVLGILLFLVEIVWFVAKPIWSEMRVWWQRRRAITYRLNTIALFAGLFCALMALAVPWYGGIPLPATLESAASPGLYAPRAALITEVLVQNGQRVEEGRPLFRLTDPDLQAEIDQAEQKLTQSRLEVIRAAVQRERAEDRLALELQRDRANQQLQQLVQQRDRLTILSPINGMVIDIPPDVQQGIWVKGKTELGRVISPDSPARVVAFATDAQLQRFGVGTTVSFHDDVPLSPTYQGRVSEVESVNITNLPGAYLAATQGGPIPVLNQPNQQATPTPTSSLYRVIIALDTPPPDPIRIRTGKAYIDGEARSFLSDAWRSAAAVLVRESGF